MLFEPSSNPVEKIGALNRIVDFESSGEPVY